MRPVIRQAWRNAWRRPLQSLFFVLGVAIGVAMIVARSGAPVLCVGLIGTTRIIPFGSVWPRPAFGGVIVNFGLPKTFEHGASSAEILGWMSDQLEQLTRSAT